MKNLIIRWKIKNCIMRYECIEGVLLIYTYKKFISLGNPKNNMLELLRMNRYHK